MIRVTLCLMLLAGYAHAATGDELPDWARQAIAAPIPAYPPKAAAVILFAEEHVTVEADGRRTMRERAVVRWLASGRSTIQAFRSYSPKSGRIREFRAWTITAAGREIRYGKERVLDVSLDDDNLYDEDRGKVIAPGDDLTAGGTFVYDVTEEDKTVFTQYQYYFQRAQPVLTSRFVLTLPAGWESRGLMLNHADVPPRTSGATQTWELTNLPFIDDEEHRPRLHAIVPRLAVTYFPAGASSLRPLKDWRAVSAWISELTDAQANLTPAIRAKSQQLTAGLADPVARIRSIGAFVQKTNYISVQMNTSRGGGYVPHPADQVLAKNYGDCKDKANLMKALLAAAGIDSDLVAIHSGARNFVRPQWASTLQFNHMILAVRVGPEAKLPLAQDYPVLGRLLFFDPTDPHTPVGDLPSDEQGSHALVIRGADGALVQVPALPPASNRVETQATASLDPQGALKAQVSRQYFGQTATGLRAFVARRDPDRLRRAFESAFASQLGGIELNSITPADSPESGQLRFDFALASPRFGNILQNRLFIFNPGQILGSTGIVLPATKARAWPVELRAQVQRDQLTLKVPEEFAWDEVPDPVRLESPYGVFSSEWKTSKGELIVEQSLEVRDVTVPAAEFARVREFFDRVAGARQASVVMLRSR